MRTILLIASALMLVSAEPPTSYSHRSSNPTGGSNSGGLSFQNVPSVATLHIPSGSSQSSQYSAPQQRSSYSAPSAPQAYSAPAQTSSQSYSAPSNSYGAPSQQQQQQPQYSAPVRNTQQSYGAPQQQQQQSQGGYSAQGSFQQQTYAAPQQSYGSPSQGQSQPGYHSQSQPANIQVSYGAPPQLPPGSSYGPPPVVTGAGPDHEIEYRVVYKPVKAPKPDLVLPPPPPKQKTIVYILVPRIEPPEPIIVPTHAPTPPSKPEVYFIRYKAAKKSNKNSGSSYGVPSGQYGSPSAPKPVVVDAPPKKREIVSVSSSSSSEVTDEDATAQASSQFGARVKAPSTSTETESSSEQN